MTSGVSPGSRSLLRRSATNCSQVAGRRIGLSAGHGTPLSSRRAAAVTFSTLHVTTAILLCCLRVFFLQKNVFTARSAQRLSHTSAHAR